MLTANVLAWGVPLTVLLALAGLERMTRLRRLRRQRVYADLAALSWVQFEQVIADAFRRHGYRVRETGGRNQADGGVDVVLQRDGETTIVQAKHWRRDRVGVTLVRELYGVQQAQHAHHALFVVLGDYTEDAKAFAAQTGVTLIEGEQLLSIIQAGLDGAALVLPEPTPLQAPSCPACMSAMVRRTAQRGALAGHDFWGCSRYPGCRGTVNILDDAAAVG
jgi:restriction system protein